LLSSVFVIVNPEEFVIVVGDMPPTDSTSLNLTVSPLDLP
jgi:hypothetical protein